MYTRRVSVFTLYNPERKILLQHRDPFAKYYPSTWGFFGGGIEEGESPEQALRREAMEELELKLGVPTFFKRYDIQEDEGRRERFMYVFPTDKTEEDLEINQHEGDYLGFFSSDEIQELPTNPYHQPIVDDIFDFLFKKG